MAVRGGGGGSVARGLPGSGLTREARVLLQCFSQSACTAGVDGASVWFVFVIVLVFGASVA